MPVNTHQHQINEAMGYS